MEYLDKTSQSRVENQQTKRTNDARYGNLTRATLVGGKCAHHCTIPVLFLELSSIAKKESYELTGICILSAGKG